MAEEPQKSEFGKGLVICLVKFAEHLERYGEIEERYKKDGLGTGWAVGSYMNGASDHLYEIEYPKAWKKDHPILCTKIDKLQDGGLALGHGFQACKVPRTREKVAELHGLAREIAVEIDRILGLEPEIGQW